MSEKNRKISGFNNKIKLVCKNKKLKKNKHKELEREELMTGNQRMIFIKIVAVQLKKQSERETLKQNYRFRI